MELSGFRTLSPRAPWLALALLVCVLVRLPTFRYGVVSDDEAIYDAMARVVVDGGVMYRETVDHKPPGLTYTYALGEWLGGAHGMTVVHLLGLLATLGTCLALAEIGRRLLAPALAGLPALLYAVTSATKVAPDGLAVNGELLMALPTALAVLLALEAGARSGARRVGLDLAAGALVGVAVLYKYQAGLVLPALAGLCLGGSVRQAVPRLLSWGLGFLAPLGLCGLYFYRVDALDDALRWGLRFNREYLHAAPPLAWAAKRLGFQLVGVVLPGALLYVGGLLTIWRLVRGAPQAKADVVAHGPFLAAWAILSVGAVGLGGRFFGHYFLQPELPLALCAAGPAARLLLRAPRLFTGALAVPALLFALFSAAPGFSVPLLDPDAPDTEAIGAAIAARTSPDETIWVWGNVPQLYFTSQRLQGVRFSFCNYLTGLSPGTPSEYDATVDPRTDAVTPAWQLVVEDLERRRPVLVLDTAAAGLKSYGKFPIADFPPLAAYLAAHYRLDGEAAGVPVYRRVD